MTINEIVDTLNKCFHESSLNWRAIYDEEKRQFVVQMPAFRNNVVRMPLTATEYSDGLYDGLMIKGFAPNDDIIDCIREAVTDVLDTDVDDLLPKTLYRVAPAGLVSSNGQQLLSVDQNDRVFFAAASVGLHQKFTRDELQDIVYQTSDHTVGQSWLTPVINKYMEPVKYNGTLRHN